MQSEQVRELKELETLLRRHLLLAKVAHVRVFAFQNFRLDKLGERFVDAVEDSVLAERANDKRHIKELIQPRRLVIADLGEAQQE